ncbi:uncharacterized protein LOC134522987 [Chroicocephalus ridibundus]|uniref:uncharacterized protein LOC134522987 n=1 Tax=Chroicocephalus ridibundus TaxID=1192867 RepID=UPI002FDCBB1A
MAWAPLLLVVLAHVSGSLVQAAVTQTPPSVSADVGRTVTITCTGVSSSYGVGWFQQKEPGTAPVTVIYNSNNRPSGIPSRFSGSASGSTATLTITGVQAEDEAVYYCGSRDGSAGRHPGAPQGGGGWVLCLLCLGVSDPVGGAGGRDTAHVVQTCGVAGCSCLQNVSSCGRSFGPKLLGGTLSSPVGVPLWSLGSLPVQGRWPPSSGDRNGAQGPCVCVSCCPA